jgi:hypothetical protein
MTTPTVCVFVCVCVCVCVSLCGVVVVERADWAAMVENRVSYNLLPPARTAAAHGGAQHFTRRHVNQQEQLELSTRESKSDTMR